MNVVFELLYFLFVAIRNTRVMVLRVRALITLVSNWFLGEEWESVGVHMYMYIYVDVYVYV